MKRTSAILRNLFAVESSASDVLVAIEQEKSINQDIHDLKGKVSSNVGKVIEEIINENHILGE